MLSHQSLRIYKGAVNVFVYDVLDIISNAFIIGFVYKLNITKCVAGLNSK